MATKSEKHGTPEAATPNPTRSCFVIMPISDVESYQPGHFSRVYEYLIAPACIKAGFEPTLASKIQNTNFIALDILKRILNADMAVCDLSSKNPNVLYELGIRQAFNKPITLIKDKKTSRIFDIQGLRDIEYDENLRVDTVTQAVIELAATIENTFRASLEGRREVNSLIQLLSIEPATLPAESTVSADAQLILNSVKELSDRMTAIENQRPSKDFEIKPLKLHTRARKIYYSGEALSSLNRALQNLELNQDLVDLLRDVRVRHIDSREGTLRDLSAPDRSALITWDDGSIEVVPISDLILIN